MKAFLRLLLALLTILCGATIASAALQEVHAGVVFEKACVFEGEWRFSSKFHAAKGGAEALPQMKGMGATERGKVLSEGGFTQTKVSNSAAKNETWSHADGSEVRVHPYGNVKQTPYKSGNNAHLHKQDASGNQLNDRGNISTDPNATHIGLPNPADLPKVRGRPHGS